MFTSAGGYDWDFVTATAATLTDVTADIRVLGAADKFEYKKTSFTFKCYGVAAPKTAILKTDNIKVEWLVNSA